MAGVVVLITGANAGIGKATAFALAGRGATVIMACRNLVAADAVAEDIRRATGNAAVRTIELDLADLGSVRQCAEQVPATGAGIDVLINNAGGTFRSRTLTPQGFERTFQVNYLGHYALTRLLLPHMRRRPQARVISVSSFGHWYSRGIRWNDLSFERRYSPMGAYANAKLAQVLFTAELARRCGRSDVFAAAVHPGFIASEFYDKAGSDLLARALQTVVRATAKTPAQGAETSVFLATSGRTDLPNGVYWASGRQARPSGAGRDRPAAQRLWDLSEKLITEAGMTLPAI